MGGAVVDLLLVPSFVFPGVAERLVRHPTKEALDVVLVLADVSRPVQRLEEFRIKVGLGPPVRFRQRLFQYVSKARFSAEGVMQSLNNAV